MKRFVLSFLLMAIAILPLSAQVIPDSIHFDENGEFSIVVHTKADARQIFLYSQAYFRAEDAVMKSKIELVDSVAKKVQVATTIAGDDFPIVMSAGKVSQMFTTEHFLLTITAKDGRFRVRNERCNFEYDTYVGNTKLGHEQNRLYMAHVGMGEKYSGIKDFMDVFCKNRAKRYAERINQMVAYIEKQIADDDF